MDTFIHTPLSEAEKRLKRLWIAHPERHLEQVHTEDEVRDILDQVFTGDLSPARKNLSTNIGEHTFIEKDMDCSFVKHMRYTPAFWHRHEFFELLIVINGTCENILPNGSFTMHTGDICIHAPRTSHSVSAFSDDADLMNILIRKSTFERSFLSLMEGDTILSTFFHRVFYEPEEIPYLMIHTNKDEELENLGRAAYLEFCQNKRYKNQMINSLLSAFFITILRHHEKDIEIPNVRMKSADDSIMFILRYMQANYTTITLHSLAHFFNYSDRQMQRIISDATGMSFTENIQQQKMARAAQLLGATQHSIGEICERIGFDSPNNFRRIFRKHYGLTPSEFRKRHPGPRALR